MPEIRNDNNEILRRFGDAYSYVADRKKTRCLDDKRRDIRKIIKIHEEKRGWKLLVEMKRNGNPESTETTIRRMRRLIQQRCTAFYQISTSIAFKRKLRRKNE